MQVEGAGTLWSVESSSYLWLLSPHICPPAPVWGPSHGIESLLNCSKIVLPTAYSSSRTAPNPFCRVQSFKEDLAPAWGPWRTTSPAQKPTSVLVPLSRGCSTCQEPAPVRALREVPASYKVHPLALAWAPAEAAGPQLPLHGLHYGLQGNLCSAAWRHLLPFLPHWLWCLQGCFSHFFSLPISHCCTGFFIFSYTLSTEIMWLSSSVTDGQYGQWWIHSGAGGNQFFLT